MAPYPIGVGTNCRKRPSCRSFFSHVSKQLQNYRHGTAHLLQANSALTPDQVKAIAGPNPTDRAKPGSKRHVICDAGEVPLAIQLTGAKCNDSQRAIALVDAIPLLQGERGRPRHRSDCVLGDRGYDAEAIRQGLRARHIMPWLAKRNTEHGSGLGRWRWVVERTIAWLNQYRRLRVRYEKRADIHEAFLALGCVLICWKLLRRQSGLAG